MDSYQEQLLHFELWKTFQILYCVSIFNIFHSCATGADSPRQLQPQQPSVHTFPSHPQTLDPIQLSYIKVKIYFFQSCIFEGKIKKAEPKLGFLINKYHKQEHAWND